MNESHSMFLFMSSDSLFLFSRILHSDFLWVKIRGKRLEWLCKKKKMGKKLIRIGEENKRMSSTHSLFGITQNEFKKSILTQFKIPAKYYLPFSLWYPPRKSQDVSFSLTNDRGDDNWREMREGRNEMTTFMMSRRETWILLPLSSKWEKVKDCRKQM